MAHRTKAEIEQNALMAADLIDFAYGRDPEALHSEYDKLLLKTLEHLGVHALLARYQERARQFWYA